jgi:hypothetical protein
VEEIAVLDALSAEACCAAVAGASPRRRSGTLLLVADDALHDAADLHLHGQPQGRRPLQDVPQDGGHVIPVGRCQSIRVIVAVQPAGGRAGERGKG